MDAKRRKSTETPGPKDARAALSRWSRPRASALGSMGLVGPVGAVRVGAAIALAGMTCASAASADVLTPPPATGPVVLSPSPATVDPAPAYPDRIYDLAKAAVPTRHHRTFGMTMDIGVPDGVALGLSVRPRFDWLRLGAAVTHNGMAPGVRIGVTIDPIAFPIAPTLTIEGGHYWAGTLPTVQGSPAIGYDYANFHLGLEIGNRQTLRVFLRGGASWVDMSAVQAQNTAQNKGNGSSIGNPSYNGWLAPSAKLGFSLYF